MTLKSDALLLRARLLDSFLRVHGRAPLFHSKGRRRERKKLWRKSIFRVARLDAASVLLSVRFEKAPPVRMRPGEAFNGK